MSDRLRRAVQEKNINAVSNLIARGAAVNATDSGVRSPLYEAASSGTSEIVKF